MGSCDWSPRWEAEVRVVPLSQFLNWTGIYGTEGNKTRTRRQEKEADGAPATPTVWVGVFLCVCKRRWPGIIWAAGRCGRPPQMHRPRTPGTVCVMAAMATQDGLWIWVHFNLYAGPFFSFW